jgi:Stage II sporulation protein E (SpoIIE)
MTITQVSMQSADDIEEARLRAVERYAILDTPADEAFDRIARVAARCLGAPMATIAFVDAKRTWFKATHGVANLQAIERDRGLWSSVILDDAPCVVRDTAADPRTSGDHFGVDDRHIRFYAGALQRSLLPPSLPYIPGLSVAAHYHPATSSQVGGDFYDVFALDKRRWAFFLGDVEGHGTAAASVTSLVRHTLRAAALHHEDPTDGLAELNTVLVGDPNEKKFCTVMFGMLAAEEGNGYHVRLATGGHLPALLLDPETGTVSEIRPEGGMFVGAVSDATFDQCTLRLQSGQSLLLYTDGITEARPDGVDCFGEDALRAFLADRVALRADELIGELATLVPDLHPDDDVALLALSAE